MEHNEPELREMVEGFRRMLGRALDARSAETPSDRANLYDQAREALRRHLAGIGLDNADRLVAEQSQALEFAIDEVEAAAIVAEEAFRGSASDNHHGTPSREALAVEAPEQEDLSQAEGASRAETPPLPVAPSTSGENDASADSRGLFDRNQPDDSEPSLFDGAIEIADDPSPPSSRSERRIRGASTLALTALVVVIIVAIGYSIGDPRRLGADRYLAEISVVNERLHPVGLGAEGQGPSLRSLDENTARVGESVPAQPQPTLIGDRGAPLEAGQTLSGEADDDRRIEVFFPENGFALKFQVGQDRAPNGTVRDVVWIEIEEAPEPIVNLAASSLMIPGTTRERSIEGLPVRIGMHRIVVGLMERIEPLLLEEEAIYAILHFQLGLESGRRLTLAIPFEAGFFARD